MKKNAALIAGIMFVAGCASSQGQRASYYETSPSQYDRADVSVSSTEHIERTPSQSPIPVSDVDVSSTVSVNGDDGISADSSIRGGSLDARGYDQDANNDELEGRPEPINPGKQADSSIRGGSIFAREREWNHDSEPSSAQSDPKRHMKADSSIRGGSLESRGAREAARVNEADAQSGFNAQAHIDAAQENDGDRDDFGQGSSASWESDKADGSVRGSANWNPSDDLLLDGTENGTASSSSSSTSSSRTYEYNNDASVGGAATSESGVGASSLDDEELDSQNSDSEPAEIRNDDGSSISIESDLNSSDQLESNISGDIDLEKQDAKVDSTGEASLETSIGVDGDENASDRTITSSTSLSTTDIHHDEADLTADSNSDSFEVEAAGTAASSEVGSSSSSDEQFQSNDPALKKSGSPLGTSGNEPNFLLEDNRARGVGSAASGDFASSPVNQGVDLKMGDDQLEQKVKATLTRESTGTHGLMMHQVARNIQVAANQGEITLTGTVPSEHYKDMVEVRAKEIAGVKSVKNELSVAPEADPAEREIIRGSDLEDRTSELQD